MKYQQFMIDACRNAADDLFKNARAVPADKLNWSPLDAGRSVINLCQEIAMTPTWAYDTITSGWAPAGEEGFAEQQKMMEQWTTVDDCERQFNERFAKLSELYLSTTDEQLNETKWLPYDGGRDFTTKEMMEYPRWNCTYHLGQIAYIQILYGDKEMH